MKRLAYPSRQIASTTPLPRRRRMRARSAMRGPEELAAVGRRGIMERDGTVRLAVDELPQEWLVRCVDFGRRAVRDHAALRHEVDIVDDLQRLDDVVRDDDRRCAERVVQA